MTIVKTNELTGTALDYAVALAIDFGITVGVSYNGFKRSINIFTIDGDLYQPSTNWSQGGPLIEEYEIDIYWESSEESWVSEKSIIDGNIYTFGKTPLIAAMRALVAHKLGNEVDIPEELKPINQEIK